MRGMRFRTAAFEQQSSRQQNQNQQEAILAPTLARVLQTQMETADEELLNITTEITNNTAPNQEQLKQLAEHQKRILRQKQHLESMAQSFYQKQLEIQPVQNQQEWVERQDLFVHKVAEEKPKIETLRSLNEVILAPAPATNLMPQKNVPTPAAKIADLVAKTKTARNDLVIIHRTSADNIRAQNFTAPANILNTFDNQNNAAKIALDATVAEDIFVKANDAEVKAIADALEHKTKAEDAHNHEEKTKTEEIDALSKVNSSNTAHQEAEAESKRAAEEKLKAEKAFDLAHNDPSADAKTKSDAAEEKVRAEAAHLKAETDARNAVEEKQKAELSLEKAKKDAADAATKKAQAEAQRIKSEADAEDAKKKTAAALAKKEALAKEQEKRNDLVAQRAAAAAKKKLEEEAKKTELETAAKRAAEEEEEKKKNAAKAGGGKTSAEVPEEEKKKKEKEEEEKKKQDAAKAGGGGKTSAEMAEEKKKKKEQEEEAKKKQDAARNPKSETPEEKKQREAAEAAAAGKKTETPEEKKQREEAAAKKATLLIIDEATQTAYEAEAKARTTTFQDKIGKPKKQPYDPDIVLKDDKKLSQAKCDGLFTADPAEKKTAVDETDPNATTKSKAIIDARRLNLAAKCAQICETENDPNCTRLREIWQYTCSQHTPEEVENIDIEYFIPRNPNEDPKAYDGRVLREAAFLKKDKATYINHCKKFQACNDFDSCNDAYRKMITIYPFDYVEPNAAFKSAIKTRRDNEEAEEAEKQKKRLEEAAKIKAENLAKKGKGPKPETPDEKKQREAAEAAARGPKLETPEEKKQREASMYVPMAIPTCATTSMVRFADYIVFKTLAEDQQRINGYLKAHVLTPPVVLPIKPSSDFLLFQSRMKDVSLSEEALLLQEIKDNKQTSTSAASNELKVARDKLKDAVGFAMYQKPAIPFNIKDFVHTPVVSSDVNDIYKNWVTAIENISNCTQPLQESLQTLLYINENIAVRHMCSKIQNIIATFSEDDFKFNPVDCSTIIDDTQLAVILLKRQEAFNIAKKWVDQQNMYFAQVDLFYSQLVDHISCQLAQTFNSLQQLEILILGDVVQCAMDNTQTTFAHIGNYWQKTKTSFIELQTIFDKQLSPVVSYNKNPFTEILGKLQIFFGPLKTLTAKTDICAIGDQATNVSNLQLLRSTIEQLTSIKFYEHPAKTFETLVRNSLGAVVHEVEEVYTKHLEKCHKLQEDFKKAASTQQLLVSATALQKQQQLCEFAKEEKKRIGEEAQYLLQQLPFWVQRQNEYEDTVLTKLREQLTTKKSIEVKKLTCPKSLSDSQPFTTCQDSSFLQKSSIAISICEDRLSKDMADCMDFENDQAKCNTDTKLDFNNKLFLNPLIQELVWPEVYRKMAIENASFSKLPDDIQSLKELQACKNTDEVLKKTNTLCKAQNTQHCKDVLALRKPEDKNLPVCATVCKKLSRET